MDGKTQQKEDSHHLSSDGVQHRAHQTMAKVKKIIASPMGKRKQNGAVFGVSLGELMAQAGHSANAPVIMERLMEFITEHGLDEQGLFRISGSAKVVERVRVLFDKGGNVDLEQFLSDISALAGILKLFLRELPEPLIPSYQQGMFIRATKTCDSSDEKLAKKLHGLVGSLPTTNRNILKFLCSFLVLVTQHEDNNKMNAKSLGIVFGPNIFRCSLEGMQGLQEQTCTNVIVEKFISFFEEVFDDTPDYFSHLRSPLSRQGSQSEPSSPTSSGNQVLRVKAHGAAASPPHRPKPYRQYLADKGEVGDESPKHRVAARTRHSSDSVLKTSGSDEVLQVAVPASSNGPVTDDSSEMHGSAGGSLASGLDFKERRVNRWNSASASPHHSPRLSATRSPGMLRRTFSNDRPDEQERVGGAHSDSNLLDIPTNSSCVVGDGDGRPESPWSPAGSALSTPVPSRILTPHSNALVDDAIERTLSDRLLGCTVDTDSTGDDGQAAEGSALGSLGSGSIHRFSGEEMAEILDRSAVSGKRKKPAAPPIILLRDQIAHDNSEEEDTSSQDAERTATHAEVTSAVATTESNGVGRHGAGLQAIAGDLSQFPRRTSSVERTLNSGHGAQMSRGVRAVAAAPGSQGKLDSSTEFAEASKSSEGSPKQQRRDRPAVPARPKFGQNRSMSEPAETMDGAALSSLRGPRRQFDEVTENCAVLKPLTRERPVGPARRHGSMSRTGRARLASLPSMHMTDAEAEIDCIMKPLTLLALANSLNPDHNCTADDNNNSNSSPAAAEVREGDAPFQVVNGVKVRRRKKPVPTPVQLRMSITKDEESKRFSLTFEPSKSNGNADRSDERIQDYRNNTLPRKRHLPSVPGRTTFPPVDDVFARPSSNGRRGPSPQGASPSPDQDAMDSDIQPYAVVRTPDLQTRSSGDGRPTSTSPQLLENFNYNCYVPASKAYETMGVSEISVHVHKLKDVVRQHDTMFAEKFHRKAHQPDRRPIREVVVSMAAAKKRLEGLRREHISGGNTPPVLQTDGLANTYPSASGRDSIPALSPSPDYAQARHHTVPAGSNSRSVSEERPTQRRTLASVAAQRGDTPISSPSPDAAISARSSVHSAVKAAADASDLFAFMTTASATPVDKIWRALASDRIAADRPSSVPVMTAKQVTEEKHAVQKQLLQYESVHGRPKSTQDRHLMKPVYEYYKSLKKGIDQRQTAGDLSATGFSPPSTIETLSSTLADEGVGTMSPDDLRQDQTHGRRVSDQLTRLSPSPQAGEASDALSQSLPVDGTSRRQTLGQSLPVPGTSTYHSAGRRASSDSTARRESSTSTAPLSPGWVTEMKALSRGELVVQFQLAGEDKQRLKRRLKQYEDEFFQRTGRRVEKQDRGNMALQYEDYKRAKARIRLLETLLSKLDAKTGRTC